LPYDFGTRFILRLLVPAAILAAALYPVGRRLQITGLPVLSDSLLFVALCLAASFFLLLLDMPVYMVFQGRRFWPTTLRRVGVAREARRLERLRALADSASDAKVKLEFDLQIAEFPLERATGEARAMYPTRLGNLLASFETYPNLKYGLDGVFFWPRLWVSIDKDLREELDSAQAVVDSAVYSCTAFGLGAFLFAAYGVFLNDSITIMWFVACPASLLFSFICYRAALPRYAQYGQLFAAIFDQHRDKLRYSSLLSDLDAHMKGARSPARSDREAARAVWRFLRWHRYRPSNSRTNIVVQNWLE
jgi:hypothetical protein